MWTPGNPKTKEFSLYGRKLTTNEIFFETASAKKLNSLNLQRWQRIAALRPKYDYN
jgi:hypothetical protein